MSGKVTSLEYAKIHFNKNPNVEVICCKNYGKPNIDSKVCKNLSEAQAFYGGTESEKKVSEVKKDG